MPHDRRLRSLELTDAGRKTLAEVDTHIAEIIDSLSNNEWDQVLAGLAVLYKIFHKPMKDDNMEFKTM